MVNVITCTETDHIDDDSKECVLTRLQTAVKVQDDHEETAQTQGKNQPLDVWFSHAESAGESGGRGSRTDSGWKQTSSLYFITDKSIDPTR